MIRRLATTTFLILTCGWFGACGPAPNAGTPPPAAAQATPAPAPAKKAVMVCRNSQTGAKTECGTPNAVMVGIKEN